MVAVCGGGLFLREIGQARGYRLIGEHDAQVLTVMGRGLSPLERTILRIAYENLGRDPLLHVIYADVLIAYYGWESRVELRETYERSDQLDHYHNVGECLRFNRKRIGEKKYRSAMAAVCRTFARLEKRGLIECRRMLTGNRTGGVLTGAGLDVAKEISTKLLPAPQNGNGT